MTLWLNMLKPEYSNCTQPLRGSIRVLSIGSAGRTTMFMAFSMPPTISLFCTNFLGLFSVVVKLWFDTLLTMSYNIRPTQSDTLTTKARITLTRGRLAPLWLLLYSMVALLGVLEKKMMGDQNLRLSVLLRKLDNMIFWKIIEHMKSSFIQFLHS